MTKHASHLASFELGDVRVDLLCAGRFRLDGGAMFGVVPKPLWSRVTDADDRNRIPLALNCLLVRNGRDVVLVDTGIGEWCSEKERGIYAVDDEPGLGEALASCGVELDDVTVVLNTHLHFDHAGGNTRKAGDGYEPRFPGARYVVQRGELEWARSPTLRDRASFVPETIEPIVGAGLFDPIDGDGPIVPGVSVRRVPGHTPNIHAVVVEGGGRTLVFPSDLVPTAAHLPYPWVMGYDLEPLRTLENKISLLGEAAEKGWITVLQHEPIAPIGRIVIEEGRPRLEPLEG
jgi:glyoxylase-like metal-dependent hydrolase (beta-lactamase superfamily II)